MYFLSRGGSGSESSPLEWLTLRRLALSSRTLIGIYAVFLGTWAWVGHGFTIARAGRPGADFAIFWAASRLLLHGSPLEVYDYHSFIATQLNLFGDFAERYALPWAYPPAYVLFVGPLSFLPFPLAYLLFTGAGVLLLVKGTLLVSRLGMSVGGEQRGAALFLAVSPCVFVAAIIGQNSLWTAAVAAFAMHWLLKRPIRAGICIGLLAIKPQIAIVFPFVLVAARAWKVMAVSALTALTVTALGILVCGIQSFEGFVVNATALRSSLLDHGGQNFWLSSPAPYAALRSAGVSIIPAYLAHAAVAAVSIWAACHVWRRTVDVRLRTSILFVAVLITSPYVWHYELVWLGVALACIGASGLHGRWHRGEQTVLAIAWLLPLYEHFNRLMMLPQIGSIVLLLTLLVILQRVRVSAGVHA